MIIVLTNSDKTQDVSVGFPLTRLSGNFPNYWGHATINFAELSWIRCIRLSLKYVQYLAVILCINIKPYDELVRT